MILEGRFDPRGIKSTVTSNTFLELKPMVDGPEQSPRESDKMMPNYVCARVVASAKR